MNADQVAVRRVFRIVNGGTPTSDESNWGGEVPWATPVDLGRENGRVLASTERTLTEDGLETGSNTVAAGSLIVSTRAPIGYVCQVDRPTAFNQGCRGLEPRADVDIRFFRYQLSASSERLAALGQGSTFVELSGGTLADFPIAVPPLDEQRAIADYLDRETTRIDALIAAKRELSARVAERTAGLVENLLWQTDAAMPLRRFAARVDVGIAEAATHAYADQGVPLLRSMNIRENYIDDSDLLFIAPWFADRNRSKYVRARDILTVRTGAVGVSAVVPERLHNSQCFTQLITTVRAPHAAEFVCYALNSRRTREYFELNGWGTAQANISVPLLMAAPIPEVAPLEQAVVVQRVRDETARCAALTSRLNDQARLLAERRQALIAAAVTGQLRVLVPA